MKMLPIHTKRKVKTIVTGVVLFLCGALCISFLLHLQLKFNQDRQFAKFEKRINVLSKPEALHDILGIGLNEVDIKHFNLEKDIDSSYSLEASVYVNEENCRALVKKFDNNKISDRASIPENTGRPYTVNKDNYDFSLVDMSRVERICFPFGVEGTQKSIYLDFSKPVNGKRLLNIFIAKLGY
jgi:hypothetical protein